uniref:Uncharacterized protein n=1 Tax=Chromera velia CCMP2878 TaxID=1169474 RepID=A0A0G4IEE4_9ALVE|eukprot:Cvel_13585.t1-p1 / transcript=Cvel_13585.t1 / gene=Cvel_13585 / organism=Chromera_velia_CCMP2878 / gene_product=hypothetical protein / transcript_product=hypothetical protein / location=Cvel_scaffold934:16002-16430(+) / protein_length=143 / sequence_SO=supercontig / SO=protein_coding / is_pseudo=false
MSSYWRSRVFPHQKSHLFPPEILGLPTRDPRSSRQGFQVFLSELSIRDARFSHTGKSGTSRRRFRVFPYQRSQVFPHQRSQVFSHQRSHVFPHQRSFIFSPQTMGRPTGDRSSCKHSIPASEVLGLLVGDTGSSHRLPRFWDF